MHQLLLQFDHSDYLLAIVCFFFFFFLSCINFLFIFFFLVHLRFFYPPRVYSFCPLPCMPFFLLLTWPCTIYIDQFQIFSRWERGSVPSSCTFVSLNKYTPHYIFLGVGRIAHIVGANLAYVWSLGFPVFHFLVRFDKHEWIGLLFNSYEPSPCPFNQILQFLFITVYGFMLFSQFFLKLHSIIYFISINYQSICP